MIVFIYFLSYIIFILFFIFLIMLELNQPQNYSLTPAQAVSVLDQVAAKYMGTREDHRVLQEAVVTLNRFIEHHNVEHSDCNS